MDHADERRDAREHEQDTRHREASLDDRDERPAPHDGSQDEAVAEDEEGPVGQRGVAREVPRRGAERRQHTTCLDEHYGRGDRHEREGDRGPVPRRRREEPLGRDLETNKDEDRRDRRFREHRDEERERARGGAPADDESRGECVPGARAHRLGGGVGGVRAGRAATGRGGRGGLRTRRKSASSSTRGGTSPTGGWGRIFSTGRNAIRRTATPAMEPSSAARGTTRRAQSPTKARPTLARPIASVATIPTFHASTGSPVATITGPSTPNTIANRVGVSMPNGMAVTSSRPVRRPSLTASQVYARSPTRTPSAVPGTIRPSTRSAGNLKTPIRRLERMTSWVTLSRARPRNPLRSPEAIQAWRRSARSAVGGPLGALGAPQDPRELPRPVGERRAPREAPAVVRHLAVVELHQGAHLVSEPEPRAVGLPRAGVARLELDLHAGIDALGVRGEKIPEPARDLVVAAAGKHGGTLRRLRVRPRSSAGAAGATLLGGGFGRGAKPPAEGQHSLKPHERHFLHPSS